MLPDELPEWWYAAWLISTIFGVVWVVFWTTWNVWRRKKAGKYFFKPEFPDATFEEKWASGASRKNVLTSIGGASNCLWVAVIGDMIRIGLHFPFAIFAMDPLDLEHEIAAERVVRVEPGKQSRLARHVDLIFINNAGNEQTFRFYLKDPEGFVRSVEKVVPS